ncbi:MAG TPA: polyphosphate:AMP phosphotransferase [Geminicoccaceae bacterium]|mgnify:CR=1 FL=1|nr:polyphosphate:AMP phosphotransferase [Geminicoccus sp.]HMU48904.1 polyphosphate:AMP phosphotransferase [Geminicoccaceae bacterium]
MFESAIQHHALDKETWAAEEPELHAALIDAQLELVERRDFAVVLLVTGFDGAGKGAVIRHLYEWLDPRHLRSNAYDRPTDEERARPRMWRYWRDLPPRGEIAVVFNSWYNEPLIERARGDIDEAAFERELTAIDRFERMLADEGVLLLKFLLVVSRKEQKRRLALAARTAGESRHVLDEWGGRSYRRKALSIASRTVRQTSSAHAPWIVIPSDDPEYRDLTFGRTIAQSLRARLDNPAPAATPSAPALIPNLDNRTVLDTLDLSLKLEPGEYKRQLGKWQDRLAELADDRRFRDIAVVAAFEGADAAGKGGAIRRVTAALDPRRLRIHPIAAPTDEEKVQPYLWRFWRRLPRKGHVAVFDRTWYGRVLVERVEGFASEAEWLRAYGEINQFEEQLAESGIVVAKFYLGISKEEQLRRFEARAGSPLKRFKITDEDWRNREKWDSYAQALSDMVDRTSTPAAPWTLVAAEDKRWARVKVLKTLCRRIEAALG